MLRPRGEPLARKQVQADRDILGRGRGEPVDHVHVQPGVEVLVVVIPVVRDEIESVTRDRTVLVTGRSSAGGVPNASDRIR